MAQDQLFQLEGGSFNCRILKIDRKVEYFTVEKRSDVPLEVFHPCLVRVPSAFVFSIGGRGVDHQSLKTVIRYDTEADTWCYMPELNLERAVAGGCYLNGSIYTFCGHGNGFLNSIEMLRVGSSEASWQLIEPSET